MIRSKPQIENNVNVVPGNKGMPGNRLRVSVLVHNRNRASILDRCLRSVAALDYPGLEVIVLDAQSTDGSDVVIRDRIAEMKACGVDARSISCPVLGCPASRNLAAAAAAGDLLFFVDNDATIANPGDLAEAVTLFLRDPRFALVSFKVLMRDSADLDPFSWVFRRPQRPWKDRSFDTFTFAGAGFMVRASAYREMGGFWERLIYSREEEEMSYGLLDRGWSLVYSPVIAVRHFPTGRSSEEVARRRAVELRNGVLVLWRRLPALVAIPLISARIASMIGRGLIVDPGSLPLLWQATIDAVRQVLAFEEARHPIGLGVVWRYIALHFRRHERSA